MWNSPALTATHAIRSRPARQHAKEQDKFLQKLCDRTLIGCASGPVKALTGELPDFSRSRTRTALTCAALTTSTRLENAQAVASQAQRDSVCAVKTCKDFLKPLKTLRLAVGVAGLNVYHADRLRRDAPAVAYHSKPRHGAHAVAYAASSGFAR